MLSMPLGRISGLINLISKIISKYPKILITMIIIIIQILIIIIIISNKMNIKRYWINKNSKSSNYYSIKFSKIKS